MNIIVFLFITFSIRITVILKYLFIKFLNI